MTLFLAYSTGGPLLPVPNAGAETINAQIRRDVVFYIHGHSPDTRLYVRVSEQVISSNVKDLPVFPEHLLQGGVLQLVGQIIAFTNYLCFPGLVTSVVIPRI